AGSGFESTVRLAKSSPEMWVPIFFKNKYNILDSLNHYINNLEMFKDMIEKDDFERLNQELNQINRIKKILNK
ncbi:MAG: prephenate dehydrogenase dimerization domain-containing protein, partial [Bacteroidota bacterium]|nr:prephenate dehydrogenase dimerization domain-containing protein [Bacteroidota bacterium]